MSFFTFFDRTKKHFALTLIVAMLLPSVYFAFPQKAEAFIPVQEVGGNFWTNLLTTIEDAFGVYWKSEMESRSVGLGGWKNCPTIQQAHRCFSKRS